MFPWGITIAPATNIIVNLIFSKIKVKNPSIKVSFVFLTNCEEHLLKTGAQTFFRLFISHFEFLCGLPLYYLSPTSVPRSTFCNIRTKELRFQTNWVLCGRGGRGRGVITRSLVLSTELGK